MENNFKKLYTQNVSDKTETKDNLTYLSWAYAWAEIKKIDPNTSYKVYENAEGLPYFSSSLGFFVKVGVTFEGLEHINILPVMNGANKAMKGEAYTYEVAKWEYVNGRKQKTGTTTKTVEAADAMDINKAIQRALVKAIAMHGLGLYIYAGEDLPEKEETTPETTIGKKSTEQLKADADQHAKTLNNLLAEDKPKIEETEKTKQVLGSFLTSNQLGIIIQKFKESNISLTENDLKKVKSLTMKQASEVIGNKVKLTSVLGQ